VIVLDTTVLAYAAGADHPLREPCARLLDHVAEGRLVASTTVEVIQEFAHVHARRRERRVVVRAATAYADLLAPLLVVSADDLAAGLRIFEKRPSLGAFDAVLVAVTVARGADALVSADRSFAAAREIRHVDPATPALEELLETP
jgi:uncharacterized protein